MDAPPGADVSSAQRDDALINNPAQLLVRFPFYGDTDMENATYWTGVAKNSTAGAMEHTLRWGCVCPWTAPDAVINANWGLYARQFILAVGYHDSQDLGLNDDGLPTNKVVWQTSRERVAGLCTSGKIFKWLVAPPPLVAKQAPRPAWLAVKPPGPQKAPSCSERGVTLERYHQHSSRHASLGSGAALPRRPDEGLRAAAASGA